ncbi:copper chaperone PCu(A)C [Chachezhania sediminis]|uniref:copper chaperone PCu(A)C n=1 Tax=Chachezhania sediminis TaxID=2599291 RepID=UPI00131EABDA|nr:copper chaperone PCu(A)C [Chachezhania sediminis]
MNIRNQMAGLALAALSATAAWADPVIEIVDPYARVASPTAMSGAAFMVLRNTGDTDDRLIAVRTQAAAKSELHTHKENDQGVMQMMAVEDGFAVPAGGDHALARGGDHVMLMGLSAPLAQGDAVPMVFVFEKAGEIAVDVPVDNERKPEN